MRHSRVGSFLLSLLLLALTSCGGSDGPGGTGPDTPGGTVLSISLTSVSMSFLGETATLTAALRDQNGQPAGGSISWSSDNSSVVTVVAGLLTAIQNGTATVTVSSGSLSGTVAITVQQVATQLAVVSGDEQTATVGQTLGEALVTRCISLLASTGRRITTLPWSGYGRNSMARSPADTFPLTSETC